VNVNESYLAYQQTWLVNAFSALAVLLLGNLIVFGILAAGKIYYFKA